MKITIELDENTIAGIKDYMKEVDGIKPTKSEIVEYVQGIVLGTLNAPGEAVSDYIRNRFATSY